MPKKEKVREMFDHIAPSYDKLNHILSLNVDKLWRRHALKEIVDGTPQRILDVACGTGDSTISIAKAAAEGSKVIGADISEGMMALVKGKAEKAGVGDRITLQVADGEALPYGEGTFDRVTCAFGIRNFEHKEKGPGRVPPRAEARRKGGRPGTVRAAEPAGPVGLRPVFPARPARHRRRRLRRPGRLQVSAGLGP